MSKQMGNAEQLEASLKRVRQRLQEAISGAEMEGELQTNPYYDGIVHGLRAALRMLEEEVGR